MAFIPKGGNEARKERQRARGWKVECDSSIDPEAARSKMASQEKEVGGGRDGSEEMARRERGRGRLTVVSQSVKLSRLIVSKWR